MIASRAGRNTSGTILRQFPREHRLRLPAAVIASTGRSPAPEPRSRRARVATIVLSSIVVVALLPLAFETVAALLRGDVQAIPFFLIFLLLPANLGLVGAVLTIRRPENLIGWLLLVAGVLAGFTFAAGEYERSVIAAGGSDSAAARAGRVGRLLLVHPRDRDPRRLPAAAVPDRPPAEPALAVGGRRGHLRRRRRDDRPRDGARPDGRSPRAAQPVRPARAIRSRWIETAATLSSAIAPPVFALALASLFIRFRRSRGVERQQIKWFLFVAAIATVLFAVSIARRSGRSPTSRGRWAS